MRIIKKATLAAFWAKPPGQDRLGTLVQDDKGNGLDVSCGLRATFPHADPVTVRSGRKIVVFNIGGNKYRLITAIHYNRGLVFTLMVLTHAEYGQEEWKDVL